MNIRIVSKLVVVGQMLLAIGCITGCQSVQFGLNPEGNTTTQSNQFATLSFEPRKGDITQRSGTRAALTSTPVLPSPTISSSPAPSSTLDPATQVIYSPDDQWVAKLYLQDFYKDGIERIEIQTLAGDIVWTIVFRRTLPIGDPHRNLIAHSWSSDSSKLYYYYVFGFDGPPTIWNGYDLFQVDILTGIQTALVASEEIISFAFSPTGEKLAYILAEDDPRRIYVRDLVTNQSSGASIGLPEYHGEDWTQAGWIIWSTDEEDLLLVTEAGEQMELIHVELPTLRRSSLINFWYSEIEFEGWTEDGCLVLFWPYKDAVSYLDVDTNTFTDLVTAIPESR